MPWRVYDNQEGAEANEGELASNGSDLWPPPPSSSASTCSASTSTEEDTRLEVELESEMMYPLLLVAVKLWCCFQTVMFFRGQNEEHENVAEEEYTDLTDSMKGTLVAWKGHLKQTGIVHPTVKINDDFFESVANYMGIRFGADFPEILSDTHRGEKIAHQWITLSLFRHLNETEGFGVDDRLFSDVDLALRSEMGQGDLMMQNLVNHYNPQQLLLAQLELWSMIQTITFLRDQNEEHENVAAWEYTDLIDSMMGLLVSQNRLLSHTGEINDDFFESVANYMGMRFGADYPANLPSCIAGTHRGEKLARQWRILSSFRLENETQGFVFDDQLFSAVDLALRSEIGPLENLDDSEEGFLGPIIADDEAEMARRYMCKPRV